MKNEKLYKLFNDVNRHNKKYINESEEARQIRKAKEYCKNNKVANGIKETYGTGVRTYKNFGVYDIEKGETAKGILQQEMNCKKENNDLEKKFNEAMLYIKAMK